MFLVDTNVWLERLLGQERSDEVGRFLGNWPSERLFITDFSFHSIGVILSRLRRTEALRHFVNDAFVDGAVSLIRLEPNDTDSIIQAVEQFNLDFDDAYQYVAADKHNLTLVSFDADFDRTRQGRKSPSELTQG